MSETNENVPTPIWKNLFASAVIAALVTGLVNFYNQRQIDSHAQNLEAKKFSYDLVKQVLQIKDRIDRRDAVELILEMKDLFPQETIVAFTKLSEELKNSPSLSLGPLGGREQTDSSTLPPSSILAPSQTGNDPSQFSVVIETKNGNAYAAPLTPVLKGLKDAGFKRDFKPETLPFYGQKGDRALIKYGENTEDLANLVKEIVHKADTKLDPEVKPDDKVPSKSIYLYIPY
ncbi:MAG: hypothetical protein JO053_03555 [Acidobacteria bacterium]|nr:hypothetical protein [Acidobacteriota bacterium]MBV9657839.1 hypothetical protein [Verrucomicrobiota bacterium]